MAVLGQGLFAFGKKEGAAPDKKAARTEQPEISSSAEQESENAPRPMGEISVSGRVRIVGSAIFTEMVISDAENRDWYISKEEQKKLSAFEQRTVTVKGTAFFQDLILANGKKIGIRYTLRDIAIVEL